MTKLKKKNIVKNLKNLKVYINQKVIIVIKLKIQILGKARNSNCERNKTSICDKTEKSNGDKTQKLKLYQNSNTENVTKLKT